MNMAVCCIDNLKFAEKKGLNFYAGEGNGFTFYLFIYSYENKAGCEYM